MTPPKISAIFILVKNLNGEETLWVILPILIVVGILVASIIILPQTQTKTSSQAATPTATPTKVVVPTASPTTQRPEVVCSSLYSPVCSQAGVTYANECEANQAGVVSFTNGACKTNVTTTKTVSPAPKVLPTSN